VSGPAGHDPGQELADSEGTAVPERGWVSEDVSEELAGVGVQYLLVDRGSGRSPRAVKDRLKDLAGRFSGAQAINLRHQAIPWAYRVFFRHIGLDPDEQRTPVEEVALERMRKGGFPSVSLLDDALTIAIAESGVALRAFDADKVEGRLGIRLSASGEPLEGRPGELPPGTLVIADETRPLALLFGATGAERGVSSQTKRTLLCAIQVKGVPDIAVEEALWLAAGVMRG
jgi:DNA/RNA-binding domain of Phe-tRNA-synthetase-like protein